jgi:hypothetical protein
MKTEKRQPKEKLPYEKPLLRTIELTAEEVLVAGCKTITGGGDPGPPSCADNNCSTIGS